MTTVLKSFEKRVNEKFAEQNRAAAMYNRALSAVIDAATKLITVDPFIVREGERWWEIPDLGVVFYSESSKIRVQGRRWEAIDIDWNDDLSITCCDIEDAVLKLQLYEEERKSYQNWTIELYRISHMILGYIKEIS